MRQANGYAWMYERMAETAKRWGDALNIASGVLGGVVGTAGVVAIAADGKYRALTEEEVRAIIMPAAEKVQKDDWQKLAGMVRKLEGLETITSDKRTSSIIEEGSTVGATFGALVSDIKRLFTDAGRMDLIAKKEEKAAVEAVAYLTTEQKQALMAKLAAELA